MAFFKTSASRRFALTIASAATVLAVMTVVAVPARAVDRGPIIEANRQYHEMPPMPRWETVVLPADCVVMLQGHRQAEVVYPAHCLRSAGVDFRLPQQCEVTLQAQGLGSTGYEQNCLLKSGFRLQGPGR